MTYILPQKHILSVHVAPHSSPFFPKSFGLEFSPATFSLIVAPDVFPKVSILYK